MSLIIFSSDAKAPGTLQPPLPRYEVGKFFVTIFHADKRTKVGDEQLAGKAAKKLLGCLGELRPMCINMYHPSLPPSTSAGSVYTGTKEEMHEDSRLAHIHIELIGKQRDDGFTETEIETIKSKLDSFKWT